MGVRRSFEDVLLPAGLLALIGLVWEEAVHLWGVPHYILPAPTEIFSVMWSRRGLLLSHSAVTLAEIGVGFAIAAGVGFMLAYAIHSSRIMERTLMPLIIASQTIPVFAIAPLLILWFGYGMGSKVVMAAIIVFFPIVINTVAGLRASDPDILSMLRIMEASSWQILVKVMIPQSLPFVFSGLKIGVAVAVIGAVIGEWVGARKGLGYLMIHANAQLQVDLVFASIFVLSIMGILLYILMGAMERIFIPWRRSTS